MIIYGIPTCDTCRKARKALAGHDPQWRDIRALPLSKDEVTEIVAAFGDRAVNRSSTTWRGLGDDERALSPRDLILKHPTIMKRPVIRSDSGLHLGWGNDVQAALLP
ncbi:arsenate reductase family protein [Falsirhodobacter deserti]|uniref:arsenate reductase family protein n=1 Tax=Falsirhodobacter deserti TaxID=1365611 RepID=UPI000FE30269|nr:ArsC/Spx/MgsR family protein [Falsirhodobacter deserti]